MELKEFIEIGERKAGSLTALGKILDVSQPNMSHCKAHKARLPLDAASKLADYIEADLRAVIAANQLATETKEQKKAYWRPFVEHARAASIAAVLAIALALNFVTPTPTEAAPMLNSRAVTICIMLSRYAIGMLKQSQLFRAFQSLINALQSIFPSRVAQV